VLALKFVFPHMYIRFEGYYHQQNIMIFPYMSHSYSINWYRAGSRIIINITPRNLQYITPNVLSKSVTMIYNHRVFKRHFLDETRCPMVIFDANMVEPMEVSFQERENSPVHEQIVDYHSYLKRFRRQ